MNRARALRRLPSLLTLTALAACAGASDIDPPTDVESVESVGQAPTPLAIDTGAITHRDLDVCWNFDGWEHEKAVVRQAVEDTWMTQTRARIVNWERCGDVSLPGDHDIWIDEHDAAVNPHSPIGGSYWKNMSLNFIFQAWKDDDGNPIAASGFTRGMGVDGLCKQDQAHRDYCIRVIAVHEFGHALGFTHEQNRSDAPHPLPGTCKTQGSNGNATFGPWDLDSVMNYCNWRWNNWGDLSPWDILGTRQYYGERPHGLISGRGADVLDVSYGSLAEGARVGVYMSNGGQNQQFAYYGATQQIVGQGDRCLVADGANQNGTSLAMRACRGTSNEKWELDRIELRYLGKCLDRKNTTSVTLERCDGRPTQKWAVFEGEIHPAGDQITFFGKKCLDVAGGRKDDGAPVGMTDCRGAASQKWKFAGNGQITVYAGVETKCLEVKDMRKDEGAPLQTFRCWGGDNQRFTMRGELHPFADYNPQIERKCLEVDAATGKLELWQCNGWREETWDFDQPATVRNGVWQVPGAGASTQGFYVGGAEPYAGYSRPLQVCVGAFGGGEHPGKLIAGQCHLSWGGVERLVNAGSYKVLTNVDAGSDAWVPWTGGMPRNAIFAGREANGAPLAICRADFAGGKHPGKVVGTSCAFAWGGVERWAGQFEVLTVDGYVAVAGPQLH